MVEFTVPDGNPKDRIRHESEDSADGNKKWRNNVRNGVDASDGCSKREKMNQNGREAPRSQRIRPMTCGMTLMSHQIHLEMKWYRIMHSET